MGACCSSIATPTIVAKSDGNEADYRERFEELQVLGEGEFGQVKLVRDRKASKNDESEAAVKTLKKGFTFKDNTLYAPMKPQALQMECDILRVLDGKKFNLKLLAVYEAPSMLFVVTELCSGGEMMEYVTDTVRDGLRTEDVSRISCQLLSAVDHCAKHGIIHRDIKPENVMFKRAEAGSELRLIDFGCATMDGKGAGADADAQPEDSGNGDKTNGALSGSIDYIQHGTFAGSAFYISPEMFQRTYTAKTDVWSAGVTLYVLVAGYPADCLQKAFNSLQTSKSRDLRSLPNMPDSMPDSYFDMLHKMLVYRHKQRCGAGELLDCDFVRFHQELEADGDDAGLRPSTRKRRTQSVVISGVAKRHSVFLDWQVFERSVTTILATVPTRAERDRLLEALKEYRSNSTAKLATTSISEEGEKDEDEEGEGTEAAARAREDEEDRTTFMENERKLQTIKMRELNALLGDMSLTEAASKIRQIQNSSAYDNFAYRIALLREFSLHEPAGGPVGSAAATPSQGDGGQPPPARRMSSALSRNVQKSFATKRGGGMGGMRAQSEAVLRTRA